MPKLFTLALSLLPWIPAILCGVNSGGEHAVLEGQSLTVPCHYEPQYANHVKYWCRGKTREFCTSLARTDGTHSANPAEDKVSISDHKDQLLFSVTMNNLKEGDSGWYMCGVEISGMWTADVVTYAHIKVVHGLSVVNSEVSGEEGSSVTVECLYGDRYRESEKRWCRSGNSSSCLLTGSEGSYEDTSVAISDDRTRTFTITLKKLQLRDTGWYWCYAGQQKIAVRVVVTPRPTTNGGTLRSPAVQAAVSVTLTPSQSAVRLPPPRSITQQSWDSHSHIMVSLLLCASIIILVGMAILARQLWRRHSPSYPFLERDTEKARINTHCVCDLQNNAVIFHNRDSQDVHMCLA